MYSVCYFLHFCQSSAHASRPYTGDINKLLSISVVKSVIGMSVNIVDDC